MKLTPREEQFTKFIAEAQPESDHDKRKPPKAGDDLAHGLACLVASQKFFPGDAAAVIDAFG
jgi:hypothetical protein